MKIYFAASIMGEQGGGDDKKLILDTIKSLGHTILTEMVILLDTSTNEMKTSGETGVTPEFIYRRDTNWVEEADLVVAEVSRISLGVGYEIGWKLAQGGQVLAICKEERFEGLSNFIKGIDSENFKLIPWESTEKLLMILKNELGDARNE